MIRQVVVGTDGSQGAMSAVLQGLAVARETGSILKCVFTIDLRKTQLPYIYSGGFYEGALERIYVPLTTETSELHAQLVRDLDAFAAKHIEDVSAARGIEFC